MSYGLLLTGVGMLICGVVAIVDGYRRWEMARMISETPTTDVRHLNEEGVVGWCGLDHRHRQPGPNSSGRYKYEF